MSFLVEVQQRDTQTHCYQLYSSTSDHAAQSTWMNGKLTVSCKATTTLTKL